MNTFGILQAFHSWYGATVMFILMSLSIYTLALAILRFKFFNKIKVDPPALMAQLHKAIDNNDSQVLTQLRGQRVTDAPVRILMSAALRNNALDPNEVQELFNVTRILQRDRLTKHLNKFSTIATIAPFLGLLGTVVGIIESFNALAQSGAAGPNVVASGVAEALWATATGLVAAIPSVICFTHFRSKALKMLSDMEVIGRELLVLFRTGKMSKLKFQ